MSVRKLKPITPGQRFRVVNGFDTITTDKPEKSLLAPKKRSGGRNNQGRMTTRNIGGGHKQKYRIIDFKRDKTDIPAEVLAIEYDPNRNARIALVQYEDGEKRYILAPAGIEIGATIIASENAPFEIGNALPLEKIPLGTEVHNIEMKRGKGGQIVRAAGGFAQLMAKEGNYVTLRLPSKEVRMVRKECMATIGRVGNIEARNLKLGKAGKKRHLGIRPHVRGSAMNPCDHPHGGGEGRAPIGRSGPVSPWGKPALGKKTRKKKKLSNKYIVRRRNANKGR